MPEHTDREGAPRHLDCLDRAVVSVTNHSQRTRISHALVVIALHLDRRSQHSVWSRPLDQRHRVIAIHPGFWTMPLMAHAVWDVLLQPSACMDGHHLKATADAQHWQTPLQRAV